jgi:Rne/Rng family ribonuclease
MAKEICISSTPHETRLAILEDDQLAEIYYERENEYTLAGSIYKGRVTRVLPGMQSAFVDLGLERDAFLYVTDFIELEDQADTEELEEAAVSGAPVREPRQGNGRQKADRPQQPERQADRQSDRQFRERASSSRQDEPSAGGASVVQSTAGPAAEDHGGQSEAEGATGGRRWRGRRRRRGGRGAGASQEGTRESARQDFEGEFAEQEEQTLAAGVREELEGAAQIYAAGEPAAGSHASAPAQHAPFVLPGEQLSKYGGAPAAESRKAESVTPVRAATTSRPSTLIETPLDWDPASGLLPGESLSLRRGRRPEPSEEPFPEVEPASGPEKASQAQQPAEAAPDEVEEQEIPEEEESSPLALREIEFPHQTTAPSAIESLPEDEPRREEESSENHEPEGDASASHKIDPASPSGFRLFGLGGKKKKGQEADAAAPQETAAAAPPSSYAPGVGHIEEEVIEGEEFENAPRRSRAEEPELDDYEEQTLAQARTGDLGELLQEAHLDHRIQMRLGVSDAEDDEAYDIVEEEAGDEGETQAAAVQEGQPRRERRTGERDRGRRGRGAKGERRGPSRRSMQTTDLPVISDLLKPGQEVLVQIAKEPIAKKGARITSHIALPGRFLVFMPTVSHVGVSRKIASDEERNRLKRILMNERGEASGGFIVRTAAEGASEEELRADLRFLMNLWNEIKQRSDQSKAPALIYHDLSLIERILRDQVSETFSNIWVDTESDYERIVRFLNRFSPNLVRRVKLYTKETPLFEHFGIQDEISKALRSKVWLKSGGSIVINQTEALVAIDINTGKYVGKSARLEDTILKTNLDAVPEIVRQIRLRDLGGIIVIDFIDMDERKNRYKVMAALEEALKSDRAPTKVLQFNDFGLVAITRKRVKQSLERTLSVPCYTCQATGMVKSPTTVCNEIWVELRKMRKHFEGSDVLLRVHPETVKVLKSNNARWLNEFEELVGRNVLLKSDPALHPEQFDIQG